MSARTRGRLVAVLLLVGLLALSFLVAPVGASASAARTGAAGHAALVAPAASTPRPSVTPALSSSGRGSFYINNPVADVPAANASCGYQPFGFPNCRNDTGSPALVATSTGALALAYTAWTNFSACPGDWNLTLTEIGFSVSTDGGSSWNSPTYLNDPGCVDSFNYTSSISPALTSLGNGTLVLSYLQYNVTNNASCTSAAYLYYPSLNPCIVSHERLVVTESSDNGTTWTAPMALVTYDNPSLADNGTAGNSEPAQPALAATGNTVYLAWTNFTQPNFAGTTPLSIGLNLAVSTNGGTSFGSPVQLPVTAGASAGGGTVWMAYDPSLVVAPNGTLYVAYTTAYQVVSAAICLPSGCVFPYPDFTTALVVASSTNNGSTFSVTTVDPQLLNVYNGFTWIYGAPGTYFSPEPFLTIDPASGELYLAWTGGQAASVCFSPSFCIVEEDSSLWFSNSTNGGASWSSPLNLGASLSPTNGSANASTYLFDPSVAVGTNGTVLVNALYDASYCSLYSCDFQTSVVYTSHDHGATFRAPLEPDAPLASFYEQPIWDGFYAAAATLNGTPFFAWTAMECPSPGPGFFYYCSSPSPPGWSQVVVSNPFEGVGVTVTFNETGLPSNLNWSATFSGNVRGGPAGTNLTVSGVPTGPSFDWSAAWINTSIPGVAYAPLSVTPSSPGSLSGPTVISVVYDKVVAVNVTAVPPGYPGYAFSCSTVLTFQFYCANQVVSPNPGTTTWVTPGSPLSYSVTPISFPSFCDYCDNLSFLSWNGVGSGSWNASSPNGSTVINGPVSETVSFNILNICVGNPTLPGACTNLTYDYTFVESGLPLGTTWTVTLGNQTLSSATSTIGFSAGGGPLDFSVWTVPFNATYVYVGTPRYASPITAFQGGAETVNFTLEPIARLTSSVAFAATGLPAGVTTWGLDLNGTGYAVGSAGLSFPLGSGNITLNASNVYGQRGVAAYVDDFVVAPEQVGTANFTVAPGGLLDVNSSMVVTAQYAPMYWLAVSNSTGGTVSAPPGQWVTAGSTVELNATADPGYAFVGWSGSGPGSVSATPLSINVTLGGPVTELATFVAVIPTFNVTVSASGIGTGVPVTVQMGGTTYTDLAPFNISGLVSGSYTLSVPTVYPNGTTGVRYVPTGVSSSLSLTGGSLDVDANGTLAITYQAEYALTIAPTSNGTTSPAAGMYWESAATSVPVSASPSAHYSFAGWSGSGRGSVTSTNASISVQLSGPVSETASFSPIPPVPPATFNLTLEENKLPSGTTWSASVGSNGVSGTASTLVIHGLNGSYTLTISDAAGATAGVRYAPDSSAVPVTVTADKTLVVNFTTQFELTVSGSTGGSVTPASTWYDSGTSVTLQATPASGYVFVGWNGTGTGSYSGTSANPTFTLSAPVNEIASFAPQSSTNSPNGSTASGSPLLAIGLLAALLVVGLVVGLLLARRRPPAAPASGTSEGATPPTGGADEVEPTSDSPMWSEETPAPSPPPATPEGGDEETVYGGSPPGG